MRPIIVGAQREISSCCSKSVEARQILGDAVVDAGLEVQYFVFCIDGGVAVIG